MEFDFTCFSKADYHEELPSELKEKEFDTYCIWKDKVLSGMSQTSSVLTQTTTTL